MPTLHVGKTETDGRRDVGKTETDGRRDVGKTERDGRRDVEKIETGRENTGLISSNFSY